MKKETIRSIISLLIFAIGAAVTLPMATGVFIDKLKPGPDIGLDTEEWDFPTDPEDTDPPETPDNPSDTTASPENPGTEPEDRTSSPSDNTTSPEDTSAPSSDVTTSTVTTVHVTTESKTQAPTTVAPITTSSSSQTVPVYFGQGYAYKKVDKSFFADALFIGDSRTVGIRNASAGRFDNAVFFADIGVSAAKAMANKYEASYGADTNGKRVSLGTMTLKDLLAKQKFGKIYIMVGVNELGGSITGITNNIIKLKDMCLQYAPDAKIVIECNLHFTAAAEKNYIAKGSTWMTNDRMNQVNAKIAALADYKQIFCIDINEKYDIPSGTFNPDYSGDGVHPTSKYYREGILILRIEKRIYDLNGHTLTLRNAEKEDAEILLPYLKRVCGETRFLLREADECQEMTVEQEEAFISSHTENDRACLVLAELDGVYAGNASFETAGRSRRNAHRAEIGIALYADYTGMGIGKKLFSFILELIGKCGFESAELTVVEGNTRAIHMYESFGFTETGRIPKANKYDDGTYADNIFMVRTMKP
ncbi:MAG: GNAT family N-acetyltransferase [Clostridia bacterium]|nr:GNAT family N-acetyltransferase [Clostridia bacterium]